MTIQSSYLNATLNHSVNTLEEEYFLLSSLYVNFVSSHFQFQINKKRCQWRRICFSWSGVNQIYLCSAPQLGMDVSCILCHGKCDKPKHLLHAPQQWFPSKWTEASASLKLLKGLTYSVFQYTASEKGLPSGREDGNPISITQSLGSFHAHPQYLAQ